MKVQNFSYNGFSGKLETGYASYTAEFVKWTSDPGITVCSCSDGQERLIPTFALKEFKIKDFPPQPKTGIYFGSPCHS